MYRPTPVEQGTNFSFPFDSRRPTSSIPLLGLFGIQPGSEKWKQTIKIDKNNVYREEREGEIEVQKSGSFRWGLRVNDKDWSNGEDVTCIGKERLKCKWCLCWIWGSLNDKYVACVCVREGKRERERRRRS